MIGVADGAGVTEAVFLELPEDRLSEAFSPLS